MVRDYPNPKPLPCAVQVLPMPLDDGELADIVREVGGKLVRLELQAVRARPSQATGHAMGIRVLA